MARFEKNKNIITLIGDMQTITIDLNTLNIMDTKTKKHYNELPDRIAHQFRMGTIRSIENFTNNYEIFFEFIYQVINNLEGQNRAIRIGMIGLYEKVIAVGLSVNGFSVINSYEFMKDIELNQKNVQYLKDFNNGVFDVTGCKSLSLQKFVAKYNLDSEQVRNIADTIEDIKDENYIEYVCLLVGFRNIEVIENWRECVNNYYEHSIKINNNWVASKHFFDDYCKIEKEYAIFLDAEKAKALMAKARNDLAFQYGEYMVIVPNTPDQYKDEASQQKNCVYRIYLDSVLNDNCHIVFIRNINDTTKSVVTCEIETDGSIGQFLLKGNNRDISYDLREFKMKYAEYLQTLSFNQRSNDDCDDDDDEVEDDEWEIDNGDGGF